MKDFKLPKNKLEELLATEIIDKTWAIKLTCLRITNFNIAVIVISEESWLQQGSTHGSHATLNQSLVDTNTNNE